MFQRIVNISMAGIVAAVFLIILSACTGGGVLGALGNRPPTALDYAWNHQDALFQESARAVGFKQLQNSAELDNILRRVDIRNNPYHKSWVIIYANNGAIKAEFGVIGPCTANDSSASPVLTNHNQNDPNLTHNNNSNNWWNDFTVDAPGLDGSFGGVEPGIFCFLDKPGRPMVQFNGDYIWSDVYIPLKQAPELVIGKVSK